MNARMLLLVALPALVTLSVCGEKEDSEGADGAGTDGGVDDGGSEGQTTVCGDETCTPDQYCYTFVSGVKPDSGSAESDPICQDAPPECAGIATCVCLEVAPTVNCGECSDSDGVYCKEYGA